MLEGEEWKHSKSEYKTLTLNLADTYLKNKTRLLWLSGQMDYPADGHIREISDSKEFALMSTGNGIFGGRLCWLRLDEIKICSTLQPIR
jgi:hypothetical protein